MDNQKIDETFQLFAELIEERFDKRVFTTEDSVRYTFFYCLTQCMSLNPSNIILEQVHPSIPRAEVDMHVQSKNGVPELFFEFKFDRAIPSEKNAPRPQKAGKVFADIFRLALAKPDSGSQHYLVYVTDREMATYLMNIQNRLADFFNLQPNERLTIDEEYIRGHCDTFIRSIGTEIIPSEIICRLSKKAKEEIWVRIYEIISLEQNRKKGYQ